MAISRVGGVSRQTLIVPLALREEGGLRGVSLRFYYGFVSVEE
jgi:hypothetical protein